jgi:indole-3-acetate monooxygenase
MVSTDEPVERPMDDVSRADPITLAREPAPAVAAAADEAERIRRIPEPFLAELHESRLFRMLYPRSIGGDEVEPAAYIDAVAELSRADGSVGWCVSIANCIGLFAPYLDLEAARTVFGPARATCAWGLPNDCRGIAVPDLKDAFAEQGGSCFRSSAGREAV